jgi:hypothetical protein
MPPIQPPLRRRTTRELIGAQRHLVEIMREHQFGRIENVIVDAGQPVLDANVRIVRSARLGGGDGGAGVPNTDEFELKQAVCDLLDELARLNDGLIVRLEFKGGLPFLLETTKS